MIDCAILDKLQQGIILADEQQQIVFANQYILEKLGYKELKEKSIKAILWDEDDRALLDQEEETEAAFKNGAGRKVSARVEIVLEKEEKAAFLIIKEWLQKGQEEELEAAIKNNKLAAQFEKELRLREKAERQLQDYIETNIALYSIFSVKKNKKIMDLGWQALLGWKKPDEISLENCIYKADRAEVEAKINKVIQGSIEQGVTRFNCKKGGYRWIKWKAKLAEENDGLIMFGMDVTSEVKSVEQRKVYQKALELETTKNEFLANMSHELKTPLNIIYGVLQLMEGDIEKVREEDKDIIGMDKILKHKRIMKQNIFRLLRLINNIVDISKIGAGSYTLNLQNYNIVEVIEDITMSVADYIKDKHLNVVFDTQEEEIQTACDSEKVERIMLNLLSNAVKYSKDGGSIQVRMRKLRNKVVIEVSDDGIGIPKEKQDKIFERFVQVDQSFTRKCEGSGIGLCLVKSLVELQGGTISVKSRLGEGSTFTVKLPIRQVEEQVQKLPKKVSTINTRIEKCNIEFSDVYTIS